jgi:hypothetical protein
LDSGHMKGQIENEIWPAVDAPGTYAVNLG